MNRSHGYGFARIRAWAVALAVSLLAACGGGGVGETAPVPVPVALSISTQPADQSVSAGGNASFAVVALGSGLGYQWQRSTDAGASWANVSGATAAGLSLSAVDLGQAGNRYRVVVTGSASSLNSSAVTLTVTALVTAPTISVNPAPQAVVSGADAVFAVTAAGTAPSYRWQSSADGSTWADIAGASASTVRLTAVVLADNGRRLRVIVSNSAGTVTSAEAVLTVSAAPVAPAISAQPASVSVTAPQVATLSVTAAGTPSPGYQWQISTDGGTSYTNIAAATAASYSTAATTVGNSGNRYRVVVSNASGSVTSTGAILTVAAAAVAPAITSQPLAVTVTLPAVATFSVSASGNPSPTMQWQLSTDGGATFANITGATSASYTTPATVLDDNGKRYRAVLSNSAGAVNSAAVVLTVTAPVSVLQGRAWTAGQLLESDDNAVKSYAAGIDDLGRVVVVFTKTNGVRDVLYAVRGTPGAAGVAPSFSAPVVLDAAANINTTYGFNVGVSSAGNAVAQWVATGPCDGSTYNTFGTCKYAITARLLSSTGSWEAPQLVGDTPDVPSSAVINDRGDIIMDFKGWERSGNTSFVSWTGLAWKAASQTTFRSHIFKDLIGNSVGRYMADESGNMMLTGQSNQNGTTDIVAYRGTMAAGFGAQEIIDTRGATATFEGMWSNGDKSVILWTQNNGTAVTRWAATKLSTGGAWTVNDIGAFSQFSGTKVAAFTASGDFVWYALGACKKLRWTAGIWTAETALPSGLCPGASYADAISSNGDVLRIATTLLGGAVGKWSSFDSVGGQVVQSFTSQPTGSGYVVGVPSNMDGIALLSNSGIGFFVSGNTFDVLPSIAQPAGDKRTIPSLWGIYLK